MERRARETLLGAALCEAIAALQKRLEREAHPYRDGLRYVPLDFKKESKRKGVDLLQVRGATGALGSERMGKLY